jgi:hypothetical protein
VLSSLCGCMEGAELISVSAPMRSGLSRRRRA